MPWLCKLGIHARIQAAEPSFLRNDLYRCRRCFAQWRIGGYGYPWGRVRYKDRIADADGPYDHAAAQVAEAVALRRYVEWRRR